MYTVKFSIFQQQNIEVRGDEVEEGVAEMIKNYPANPEVQKQFASETYKDYLKNIIGNRKFLEYLKKETISE